MEIKLHELLLHLREAQQKTRQEVAQALNISYTHVFGFEKYIYHLPCDEVMIKLAHYYNIDQEIMLKLLDEVRVKLGIVKRMHLQRIYHRDKKK